MNCFDTFSECSLPSTVSKNVIKMIGYHSRLRDVNLICACTRANQARYIHRSMLHFAVARNIVNKNNTRKQT